MARQRRSSNKTQTTNERKMMGLTSEQIAQLLSKTRTKGQYDGFLAEFLEGGEMGVNAMETWIELKDKKATTVKQGFDGAKGKKEAPEGADKVKVVNQEGVVYLLNLGHPDVGGEAEAA